MTASELRTSLMAVAAFVAVVVLLDSTGILSPDTEIVVDNGAQLLGGAAATVLCAVTARRSRGVERTWRRLMAAGMAGWTVGQAFWSWYQIFSDTPLPSPSMADVGYLTLPVFALPALLVFDVAPVRTRPTPLHDRLIFLLDGAIVVGSLFTLTWATALGAVVHAESPSALAFGVAIAYPLTDLVLVAIVVLLAVTRRVPRALRPQLWLLGAGLVALSASDSIFAYLVSSGADDMPPLTNAGFIAGPLLIAVAACTRAGDHPTPRHARRLTTMDRAHLLLPYALVAVTGSVVAVQSAFGDGIDTVETLLAWIVLVLVLARQVVTLLENAALLDRLSASQVELSHQAHHDPLTGLANRALFSTRLDEAIERHRLLGEGFAVLVIDLDDFKAVNDAFGHPAGDHLLYAVAQRLRGAVRSIDTVARLGGDEFAVVLIDPAEAAGSAAQRILTALGPPFSVAGRTIPLGASVGVVEPWPDETGVTADVLVNRADRAMYAGKRGGKGIAVHYRPELARTLEPAERQRDTAAPWPDPAQPQPEPAQSRFEPVAPRSELAETGPRAQRPGSTP